MSRSSSSTPLPNPKPNPIPSPLSRTDLVVIANGEVGERHAAEFAFVVDEDGVKGGVGVVASFPIATLRRGDRPRACCSGCLSGVEGVWRVGGGDSSRSAGYYFACRLHERMARTRVV